MSHYLIAVHRPVDYNHAVSLDEAARQEIDALNREMVAAGVRVFVGGLRPPESAKRVRLQSDGELLVEDGRYLEGAEYVDGFWVVDCADLDQAMVWARKAARACRASIEVRPFYE